MADHVYSFLVEEVIPPHDDSSETDATGANMEDGNLEDDGLLIDIVKGYPQLYNKVNPMYKDKTAKDRAWEEIASILRRDVKDVKSAWERLRNHFTRERNGRERPSGAGAKKGKPWALYERISFLADFVLRRKTKSNTPMTGVTRSTDNASPATVNETSGTDGDSSEPVRESAMIPVAGGSSGSGGYHTSTDSGHGTGAFKKKKISAEEHELQELASICKNYWSTRQQSSPENVDFQFASLVATELGNLSPESKRKKKSAITSILYS